MPAPKRLSSLFNVVKGIAFSTVLTSAMMAGEQGVAGQEALVLEMPGLSAKPENPRPDVVDRLMVFTIDISKSVENDEYRAMMKGFYDAAVSDDLAQQFNAGMTFAFATVFFCGTAKIGEIAVMRTSEEAKDFAEKAFWNTDTGNPYEMIPCRNTNISAGLIKARELIVRESEFGINSLERSIIVAGDGVSNPRSVSLRDLNGMTVALAQQHKTVVYGIPITMHDDSSMDLVNYYAQLITPPGLSYDTGEGYTYPLKEGRVTRAVGFEDVAKAARETFMLSMF